MDTENSPTFLAFPLGLRSRFGADATPADDAAAAVYNTAEGEGVRETKRGVALFVMLRFCLLLITDQCLLPSVTDLRGELGRRAQVTATVSSDLAVLGQ